MKVDEARHKTSALDAGGSALPDPVIKMMTFVSRVMTTTASRI
jgi:ubiquinone biosynthesis monooxygenase Coq7